MVLTDRVTGTLWMLCRSVLEGEVYFSITDEIPTNRYDYFLYEANEGPFIGLNPRIQLIVSDGRLGYDYIEDEHPVIQRAQAVVVGRRASGRDFLLVKLPTITSEPIAFTEEISVGEGDFFGNLTENGGLAAGFDEVLAQDASACAAKTGLEEGYIGKDYFSPKVFARVIVYGSQDEGWLVGSDTGSITLNILGKSAPTSDNTGTLLGTLTFDEQASGEAGKFIDLDIELGEFPCIACEVIGDSGTGYTIAEMRVWEYNQSQPASNTVWRPFDTLAYEELVV